MLSERLQQLQYISNEASAILDWAIEISYPNRRIHDMNFLWFYDWLWIVIKSLRFFTSFLYVLHMHVNISVIVTVA